MGHLKAVKEKRSYTIKIPKIPKIIILRHCWYWITPFDKNITVIRTNDMQSYMDMQTELNLETDTFPQSCKFVPSMWAYFKQIEKLLGSPGLLAVILFTRRMQEGTDNNGLLFKQNKFTNPLRRENNCTKQLQQGQSDLGHNTVPGDGSWFACLFLIFSWSRC